MKFEVIPNYYYPTTVLLIDDNERFLESISFKLDEKLAYRAYDKPYQALQYLKEEYSNQFNDNLCVSNIENIMQRKNNVDDLDLFTYLYTPNRFNEISIILVDYSMPSMTGIDFCRQLKNLPLKKILVTGEAENDLAVKAFNEGIIDKFIRKDNYRFAEEINQMIAELQRIYFQEKTRIDRKKLSTISNFYNDTNFVEYFNEILEQYQIVEFYLIDRNIYLLIDMDGKLNYFYVECLNDAEEVLKDNLSDKISVQPEFVNVLSLADVKHQLLKFSEERQKNLYPSKIIKGRKKYFCSLTKAAEINNLSMKKIVSYRSYLGL